ncbi:50S ribosomal protein L22 [Candidatus Sneabacter namystus]|uniref:Large ribosomal subunit protein uL22 n=1 Tax=Candidatus Sneabacter namystus TaxID=2601646 RepID=A0A5C0UJI6_9RICK|nr:50S ribosomal protein L22 [Candidatus Sneabacter namystus]QEK39771.1 50S ribosomal protein L22 [Candidatus Sneabacter namystus]
MKREKNEAIASATNLRVSPRKLNLVAALIRGMSTKEAITQLTFCRKRIAKDVKKCVISAIANAENNHRLRADQLIITKATVGKSACMKRIRARAKGRASPIHKFFSGIYLTIREKENGS